MRTPVLWRLTYAAFTLFSLLLFFAGNWNAAFLLLLGTLILSQLVKGKEAVEQLNASMQSALSEGSAPHEGHTIDGVLR